VLVAHFPFKNCTNERKGDDQDVLNLRRCFEKYKNCDFQAVHPQEPIQSLLEKKRLDDLFQSTTDPDVFILVILSHGNTDGLIKSDNNNCPDFSTFAVWDALKKLPKECVKITFFGVKQFSNNSFLMINKLKLQPCRGTSSEKQFSTSCEPQAEVGNNSTRILLEPNEQNFVNFFSTSECEMILSLLHSIASKILSDFSDNVEQGLDEGNIHGGRRRQDFEST
jgi:hypothetical protein